MGEFERAIEHELESISPRDETSALDWRDALERASAGRRSPRLLLAAVLVLVACTLPALALSSGFRSFLGLSGPAPVVSEAHALVSAPVGNGFFAHSWTAPSTTGGSCRFLTFDHRPAAEPPAQVNGGSECSARRGAAFAEPTAALPLLVEFTIGRRPKHGVAANWVPPTVSGSVLGSLHATKVAIEWQGGSHALVLRDGQFLGGAPALYMPPFAKFPFSVVAYDRHGREVARQKLQSPTLLLLRGEEYARLYHAWQKTHHG